MTGKGLKREQVERAIHLSAEKYCSASIMLGKTAAITHDFEIRSVMRDRAESRSNRIATTRIAF